MSSQPSVPTNVLVSDPGVKDTEVEEKVKDTSHVAEPVEAPYDYRVYNPSGTARTYTGRRNTYNDPGDQSMDAVINRYLERIQWIEGMAWKNDTDAEDVYEYSYTTGLTITEGREVNNGFNLGASYEGMSIGVDHSSRTFKTTETTKTLTITIEIHVPPRSELVFYQKRFDFRDEITFILDAWGQEWNIGPWGGYSPLTTKVTAVSIMAEEYFTTTTYLPEGPGSITVDTVASAPEAGTTRKRENATEKAKSKLVEMGL